MATIAIALFPTYVPANLTVPVTAQGESAITVAADTNFGVLTMDGGLLQSVASPSGPLTHSATDAVLGRGMIYNAFTQTGLTTLSLFGTTEVQGAPIGPGVADGMYLNASMFDTTGFDVINKGTLKQTGTGELTLLGRTRLVNDTGATFSIENDKGVGELIGTLNEVAFLNEGILKKSGTGGTSNINVPFNQFGGTVVLASGSLWFNNGGSHASSFFDADLNSSGHGGVIGFAGAHTFSNIAVTQSGSFQLATNATLTVAAGTSWQQQASFFASGTVVIGAGASLQNSGGFLAGGAVVIEQGGSLRNSLNLSVSAAGSIVIGNGATLQNFGTLSAIGPIQGSGHLLNEVDATFEGNVAPRNDPIAGLQLIEVSNRGSFVVGAAHTAVVHNFENFAGTLRVDGVLATAEGGRLLMTGGELLGIGMINAEVFVGGGPDEARFRPGLSPGTMTINGNFTLLPGGVLELEVEFDDIVGGPRADQIIVSGNVRLAGHIDFLVGESVTLEQLDLYTFIDCGGPCSIVYDPTFTYAFPGRPGSQIADFGAGPMITVLAPLVPVPEPEIYATMLAGLGTIGFIVIRRRRAGLAAST